MEYDGALPFIFIRRPTADEIHICPRLIMSAKSPWDPSIPGGNFSQPRSVFSTSSSIIDSVQDDPVGSSLMSLHLLSAVQSTSVLHPHEDTFKSLQAMNSYKSKESISPEELARLLKIRLKTAQRTLQATTSKFIRTTGALSRRFKTDKAQLRYKQLSRIFGKFYCDYLKVNATSICGYKGGVIYTNELGFYKFLPCENETSETTGRTLRYFLHVVGLPYSLHSEVDLSKDVMYDNGTHKPLQRDRRGKHWFLLASDAAKVFDDAYLIQKNFAEGSYELSREIEIRALGWTSPEIRSNFFKTQCVHLEKRVYFKVQLNIGQKQVHISQTKSIVDSARESDKAMFASNRLDCLDIPKLRQFIHFYTKVEFTFARNVEIQRRKLLRT